MATISGTGGPGRPSFDCVVSEAQACAWETCAIGDLGSQAASSLPVPQDVTQLYYFVRMRQTP